MIGDGRHRWGTLKSISMPTANLRQYASLFSALGDETRLRLISKLTDGKPHAIASLTASSKLTRQAITKHLQVLEAAGIVHGVRSGRENLFELDLKPFKDLKEYMGFVSTQWDQALSRLQAFVEE